MKTLFIAHRTTFLPDKRGKIRAHCLAQLANDIQYRSLTGWIVRVLSDGVLCERVAKKARIRAVEPVQLEGNGIRLNEIILDCGKSVARGWHSRGPAN
jgi:hypothetical protein